MKIDLKDFEVVSERNAGTLRIFTFVGGKGDLRESLLSLIRELPIDAEITTIEVSPSECYHGVRKTDSAFEKKRGCHGSYGTWSKCSEKEALEWLVPGAQAVTSDRRLDACTLSIRNG